MLLVLYFGCVFLVKNYLQTFVHFLNEKSYDQLIKIVGMFWKRRARQRLKKWFDEYAKFKKSTIKSTKDIVAGVEILDLLFEEYRNPSNNSP